MPHVAVPARARLLTDWWVGESDWDEENESGLDEDDESGLFSDESGLDEDSDFQDSDQDSDLQVPRGAAAPLAGVPVEGAALFSWEPLEGAPPFSWASPVVVAPSSQLSSQVAWSDAAQDEDVKFVLNEVPQDEKEADPCYRAAVKSAIDDDQELDERDLRQELAEGLEDLLDDEPDAAVREEREGIKFQMLKGTVRRIEALPRGSGIFEELQGTLGDEASVILAEVRAGGCWTAARARSVQEKVAVRASEICGRAAGQLVAAG